MYSLKQYLKRKKELEDELLELEKLKPKPEVNKECALERFPKNCSIILNTSSETCDGCGHYKPKK